MKNSIPDDELAGGTASSFHGEYLANVFRVIDEVPILSGIREETIARF